MPEADAYLLLCLIYYSYFIFQSACYKLFWFVSEVRRPISNRKLEDSIVRRVVREVLSLPIRSQEFLTVLTESKPLCSDVSKNRWIQLLSDRCMKNASRTNCRPTTICHWQHWSLSMHLWVCNAGDNILHLGVMVSHDITTSATKYIIFWSSICPASWAFMKIRRPYTYNNIFVWVYPRKN